MYYIICEGEENKSEYKFVKAVVTLYANNKPFSILAAGGYDNLINLISSLDGKLKCGDYVILFFDNVGDDIKVGHIPVVNLLGVLDKLCNDACCVFRYTTYYCFEELLLSYTRLQDMCIKLSKKELEEFKLLQDDMISGKNYYSILRNSDKYDNLLRKLNCFEISKGRINRENLSFQLLKRISGSMLNTWKVSKSDIGSCWISDCSNEGFMEYMCQKCKYALSGCLLKQKIEDLDKNSVSVHGEPFSRMFE